MQLLKNSRAFYGAVLHSSFRSCSTQNESNEEEYYNFSTYHKKATTQQFTSLNTRRLNLLKFEKGATRSATDFLPMSCFYKRPDDDPYKDVNIFRRDMLDSRSHVILSLDLSPKKIVDLFCDYENRRCKLCNESFVQWHSHQHHVIHEGREAMLFELLRANCGTPEDIVKMWWHRLNHSPQFNRIPSLSHSDSHQRKRRVQYLLRFLVDRKILVDTFSLLTSDITSAGRTWEFERLEFIGDNVVKYVYSDRLSCCFPPSEGGLRGRLGYFQFCMDGNEGLARTYDYLELQQFVKSERVVSKFKSDVVETLFGELQFYLFSTQEEFGTEKYRLPFSYQSYTLRAIVEHTMEELAHVIFMYSVEYVLSSLQRVLRENQLVLTRTDPKGETAPHSGVKLASVLDHRTDHFTPLRVPCPNSAQFAPETATVYHTVAIAPELQLKLQSCPTNGTGVKTRHKRVKPSPSDFSKKLTFDNTNTSGHLKETEGVNPTPKRESKANKMGDQGGADVIKKLKQNKLITELL